MCADKNDYLTAMKAEAIPAGWSGLWYVTKANVPGQTLQRMGKSVWLPAAEYSFLYRLTESTLYYDPPGTVVMEDSPFELATHLGFVMRARGRVLVTGLGLGCVARGLLKNPNVEHVTIIENSPDVLKLVAPHMPTDRLEIIEADALTWTIQNKQRFDVAWHDLWTDRDAGEPYLDLWHAQLMLNCRQVISKQGAWAFDRRAKRSMINRGFQWIG